MRRGKAVLMAVVCGLVVGWTATICRAAEVPEVSTRATQVALFKNGVGYFVRAGELPKESGAFVIRPLPASSHGTLWVTHDKDVELLDLVAREVTHTESVDPENLGDLLRTRLGKEVQLHLSDTDQPLEGTVLALPQPEGTPEADPYASGRSVRPMPYYSRPSSQGLLLVRTDYGVVGIRLDRVERVDIYDEDATPSVEREVRSSELAGRLAAAPKERAFTLSYLAKGITWAPSYRIDISEAEVAVIAGKAAVINEVEDLEDVNLHLVTGFPNLQFADTPSPLSLKLNLAQFFPHLTRPPQQGALVTYNVMSQTAMGYRPGERGPVLPQYSATGVGEAAEDLFLYPIEKVSLARGEVGYYPLFTGSVPYKHIYQWTIPDYTSETARRDRGRQEEEERQVVWHSIRLQNQTALPWTTAPAMTVAGDRILGQDTLTYTPVGGSVTVKLTRAVAVAAQQQEVEVERDPEAVILFGHTYQRVTVEGTLRVHNFKGEPIDLEIVKTFSGELKGATPEAEERQLAWGLRQVNTVNVLTWNLTVDAGEETELTYRYTVLVRR